MEEALTKTLELVFSSQRPMPARFCGSSFQIETDLLPETDEYEMAGISWLWFYEFVLKEHPDERKNMFAVLCAEDVMLGAYFITKLGADYLVDEMKKAVISRNVSQTKRDAPEALISPAYIEEYMDACLKYGASRAKGWMSKR